MLTVLLSLLPYGPLAQLYASDIIGASGAVYGLLLAYALYFPDRPIYMYFVFPIPARIFVIILGAMAFFSSMSDSGGVANATHLGGLLVAYVYLKGLRLRLNPWAEVKYRYVKWKLARPARSSTSTRAAATGSRKWRHRRDSPRAQLRSAVRRWSSRVAARVRRNIGTPRSPSDHCCYCR